jgi:hypothetical protein
MAKKTLLLSSSYQVLNFITEKKVIKLLVKEKIETINEYDDYIVWTSGKIRHPSVVRLKNSFSRNYSKTGFSRNVLIKRDRKTCQYCGEVLISSQITIDHIIPRSLGGSTSFSNCVVCCKLCNSVKGNKIPEHAGMVLLRKPMLPSFSDYNSYVNKDENDWHNSWDDYLNQM